MEERSEQTGDQDEVELPDDRVEDLEPSSDDAEDVTGGKVSGQKKYTNIVLKATEEP